jgi:exopolysaccharide production protein ExoZ
MRSDIASPAEAGLLTTLQAGRALAALAVVIHHAELSTTAFVAPVPKPFEYPFKLGYLGVDFFFVLSGFIIYFACMRLEKTKSAATLFLRKRMTRIFVPYWPVMLVLVCAYAALPNLSAADRAWGWPATLLLLPAVKPAALSVAWTLQHELVFYVLFAAAFFSGKLLQAAVLWSAAIAAAAVLGAGSNTPASFFVGVINLEFLCGVACAIWTARGGPGPDWAYYLAAMTSLAAFLWIGPDLDHRVLFGLSVALVLVPIVRLEMMGKLSAPGWLVLLGNASYAIYLIHIPLLSVASRMAARVPLLNTWQGAMIFGVLTSVLMGYVYHVLVERPGLRMARRRLAQRPVVAP